MNPAKKTALHESLNALVVAAVDHADGIREGSIARALELLASDQVLYGETIERLVTVAVKDLVASEIIRRRKTAWTPADQSATIRIQGHAIAHSLLDGFLLEDGSKLGDATKQKVFEHSQLYRARERDNRVRANFLSIVADATKKGKTVRECLDENRLRAMQAKAESE